jgi:hypothetical protein
VGVADAPPCRPGSCAGASPLAVVLFSDVASISHGVWPAFPFALLWRGWVVASRHFPSSADGIVRRLSRTSLMRVSSRGVPSASAWHTFPDRRRDHRASRARFPHESQIARRRAPIRATSAGESARLHKDCERPGIQCLPLWRRASCCCLFAPPLYPRFGGGGLTAIGSLAGKVSSSASSSGSTGGCLGGVFDARMMFSVPGIMHLSISQRTEHECRHVAASGAAIGLCRNREPVRRRRGTHRVAAS